MDPEFTSHKRYTSLLLPVGEYVAVYPSFAPPGLGPGREGEIGEAKNSNSYNKGEFSLFFVEKFEGGKRV